MSRDRIQWYLRRAGLGGSIKFWCQLYSFSVRTIIETELVRAAVSLMVSGPGGVRVSGRSSGWLLVWKVLEQRPGEKEEEGQGHDHDHDHDLFSLFVYIGF